MGLLRGGRAGGWLVALLIYASATVCFTWPLTRWATTQVYCPYLGWMTSLYQADLLLIMWIQRWVMHALATHPLGLFDANALHPVPNVLVRSEFLFGSLPIFAPVYWLSGNPVLAHNACVLVSYVLAGLFMHLLLRRWTGSTAAAYVGGLAFAFAVWRIPEGIGRPHLLQVQYLPLVLLGLERTVTTGRVRIALGTAFVIVLQSICSSYAAYIVFMIAGAYIVADLASRGLRGRGRAFGALALALIPAAAVVLLALLPYARARARGELPDPNSLSMIRPDILNEWVGFGPVLLALGALPLLVIVRRDHARSTRLITLLLACIGSWVIARGDSPIGGVLEVYAWLRKVVPGFEHIRAPNRFAILISFGVSGLAALTVAAALSALHARPWGRWLRPLVIGGAVATVLFPVTQNQAAVSLAVPVDGEIPPVYRYLAEHGDGGPLVELPMRTALTAVRTAAFAQYFSTYHWLPILNGHTGYLPPQYKIIENVASQLPSLPALELLVDCTDLKWVLDHAGTSERALAWSSLPARTRVFGRPLPGQDWLFEITASPRGSCKQNFFRFDVTLEGNPLTRPTKLEGRLRVEGLALEAGRSQERQLRLTIENTGHERWPCTAVAPQARVSLLFGLGNADGAVIWQDEIVIPHDLAPGEVMQMPLWVTYPGRAGTYTFHLRPALGGRFVENADAHLGWQGAVVVTR